MSAEMRASFSRIPDLMLVRVLGRISRGVLLAGTWQPQGPRPQSLQLRRKQGDNAELFGQEMSWHVWLSRASCLLPGEQQPSMRGL